MSLYYTPCIIHIILYIIVMVDGEPNLTLVEHLSSSLRFKIGVNESL